MRSILKATAMAAGVLAMGLFGGSLRAEVIFNSNFNGNSSAETDYPQAIISMTHSGSSTSKSIHAGAFDIKAVNGMGSPVGSKLFDAYCATLGISNPYDPANIRVAGALALHGMTNDPGSYFATSSYTDVGNRLEFLLNAHGSPTGSSASVRDAKAALSLALWKTIDQDFNFTGASTNVLNLFNGYMAFTGYSTGTVYNASAVLLQVVGTIDGPTRPYQDLLGILPPDTGVTISAPGAVPEPASVISALMGLGAAGLYAGRRARRKAA